MEIVSHKNLKTFLLDCFGDVIYMRGRFWLDVDNFGIYSKQLNNTEAELFYDGDKCQKSWSSRVLIPFLNERCLLSSKHFSLTVMTLKDDLTLGEAQVLPKSSNGSFYTRSLAFNDKILTLTADGYLTFFKVRFLGKKVKIKLLQKLIIGIDGNIKNNQEMINFENVKEYSTCIELSVDGRFLLVHRKNRDLISSCLIIYEVFNWRIVKKRFFGYLASRLQNVPLYQVCWIFRKLFVFVSLAL